MEATGAEGAGLAGEGDAEVAGGSSWPIERVLDTVALVLVATVVIRAIGSVLTAFGVPPFHVNLGAPSGTGITINQSLFTVPTSVRVQYGTSWADVISGLTLLAAVALVALPRLVWDVAPYFRRPWAPGVLTATIGAVALLVAAGAGVATGNWIWNTSPGAGPVESLDAAQGVATFVLASACLVLCWFALPFVRDGAPEAGPETEHPGLASI